jgi:uncharacterized repeat protein (TIGR01451 family)
MGRWLRLGGAVGASALASALALPLPASAQGPAWAPSRSARPRAGASAGPLWKGGRRLAVVRSVLPPPRLVDPVALAQDRPGVWKGAMARGPSAAPPWLPRDPASYEAAKASPSAATVPVEQLGPVAGTPRHGPDVKDPGVPTPGTEARAFPGTTEAGQAAALGLAVEPPDTQVAVGSGEVVEFVNITGTVFTESGAVVRSFPLDAFFGVPAGFHVSDPWVQFDAADQRFFASCTSFDQAGDSNVYLAVSESADAAGAWEVFEVASGTGVLHDQPKVGVGAADVLLAWNDFTSSGSFVGVEAWVLDKAALLAGRPPAAFHTPPDPEQFGLIPAPSAQGPVDDFFYNGGSAGYLGVVAVTGSPAAGTTALAETDLAIVPTSVPPQGADPAPGQPIDTGDDRLVTAALSGGVAWVGANDACAVPGSGQVEACLRLIEVSLATSPPTVLEDLDAAVAGLDLYYPAVAMDQAGDLIVGFSYSSPTIFPSFAATAEAAGSTTFGSMTELFAGEGPYGGSRFGDYSGAAVDPTDGRLVWLAGEFTGSPVDPSDWATGIAAVGVADLVPSVAKASTTVPVGATVAFSASVANEGPADATGVGLVDVAPHGGAVVSAVASQGTCEVASGAASCELGTLAAGSRAVVLVEVRAAELGPLADAVAVTTGSVDVGPGTAGSVVEVTSGSAPPPAADYWLVGADGGVFSFGDARFFGSAAPLRLAAPVVGMAATPDGGGYWLVGADGGVFSFGDARFFGAATGLTGGSPVVGMAATPDGGGYWLVAADGGVYSFGDARFFGAATGLTGGSPVVGMAATPDGGGYWLVAADGGVYSFGDARFFGAATPLRLAAAVVGMA